MSKRIGTVAALLAVAFIGFSVPLFATDITGVLVDEGCYTKNKANTTMAHAGMSATCAADCAKMGNQVAIVTKEGVVYEVMAAQEANCPATAKSEPLPPDETSEPPTGLFVFASSA